jgi:hypothetical protein
MSFHRPLKNVIGRVPAYDSTDAVPAAPEPPPPEKLTVGADV